MLAEAEQLIVLLVGLLRELPDGGFEAAHPQHKFPAPFGQSLLDVEVLVLLMAAATQLLQLLQARRHSLHLCSFPFELLPEAGLLPLCLLGLLLAASEKGSVVSQQLQVLVGLQLQLL